MYSNLKKRIYRLLDHKFGETKADKIFTSFIIILIILNVIAVVLETMEPLYIEYKALFHAFELFSVAIFTLEFLLRLWVSNCVEGYTHPIKGRIKYLTSSGALIDLLAILPFYLPMITKLDLRVLRLLRILRFLRFFKLGPYFHASQVVRKVLSSKKEELVISIIITFFLIIIASTLMYFVENESQPQNFSSIPETMWWSVATLTTVGYGDIVPITALGKTLTACISILGIGLFALPAGILASGFAEAFKRAKAKNLCPHCGEELN